MWQKIGTSLKTSTGGNKLAELQKQTDHGKTTLHFRAKD